MYELQLGLQAPNLHVEFQQASCYFRFPWELPPKPKIIFTDYEVRLPDGLCEGGCGPNEEFPKWPIILEAPPCARTILTDHQCPHGQGPRRTHTGASTLSSTFWRYLCELFFAYCIIQNGSKYLENGDTWHAEMPTLCFQRLSKKYLLWPFSSCLPLLCYMY